MSSMYRFTFSGNDVVTVEEFEDGVWHVEDVKNNETWSYDPVSNTVTRTEVEKDKTKVKTFTDANNDGIFISENSTSGSGTNAQSQKLYDITIENGMVTAVSESKHGEWETDNIESNEQWTYDAATDTVTRTETEHGYTETTLFARTVDNFFIRVSESYTFADGSTIISGSGSDDVYYGKADDSGDHYDDTIKSGDGDDYIESYGGDDNINGGNGNDYINSGSGNDKSSGGSGNDMFVADDSGNDQYDGGKGLDTVNYASVLSNLSVDLSTSKASGTSIGNDKLKNIEHVIAGNGDDSVKGSQSANTIYGGNGNDFLDGGAGNDSLYGDLGNDTLKGGKGNDQLDGGDGNDVIYGGQGKDTLTGGNGSDTFVFDTKADKKNTDTIIDFNHNDDTIHLDDAVFKKLKGLTDLSSHIVTGDAALDSDDFLIYNSGTGDLIYDSNGAANGGAVTIAILGTGLSIDSSDFTII